jgi:hypothetical protein
MFGFRINEKRVKFVAMSFIEMGPMRKRVDAGRMPMMSSVLSM